MLGGYLNVDFLCKSKQVDIVSGFFKSCNLLQQVKEPTRITQTSAKCLDILFTNLNRISFCVTVEELGFSDHKCIWISLKSQTQCTKKFHYVTKRLFTEQNMQRFKAELEIIDWNLIILPSKNINENYSAFHEKLTEILNLTCPLKKIKIKRNRKHWLTSGIKTSCENKRILKIFISQTDDLVLKKYYKNYEKILKKTVNVSKKINNINRMRKSNNISKCMWQIINEQSNKINKIINKNITLNINNDTIADPIEIANTFNEYFISVGSIQNMNKIPKGRPIITQNLETMFLNPVTPLEVSNIIKKLKNKTSFGIDEFPPTLIKQCRYLLITPLTYLINNSFSEAIFPDLLKVSTIKPIPKKNHSNEPKDFRPIAKLSTFSKIFETAMARRLDLFCTKFNIYDDNQHGFRKNRSTTSALFRCTKEILDIINQKHYAVGLMLDMSKAYDRVRHVIREALRYRS